MKRTGAWHTRSGEPRLHCATTLRLGGVVMVMVMGSSSALAQDSGLEGPPTSQPAQVVGDLMKQRRPAPLDPLSSPQVEYVPSRVGLPATMVDFDRSVLGTPPGRAGPQLRREGDFIVSRRGRLVRSPHGSELLFVFAKDQGESNTVMILQRCALLEAIEEIHQERGDSVLFTISGHIHVYRGVNYLLTTLAVDRATGVPDPAAVAPNTQRLETESDGYASAEVAMERLMKLRRPAPTHRSALLLERSVSAGSAVAGYPAVLGTSPSSTPQQLWREGQLILNRRGRLIRSRDRRDVLFAFEADSKDAPELPMVVLPCRLLARMENMIEERSDALVFIVSGQVYTYRGANYLLPTIMKLSVDKGNLQ